MKKLERGDIIYIDLGNKAKSSVQSGLRPCLVIGTYPTSPVATVAPLTSKMEKTNIPVHVDVTPNDVMGCVIFAVVVFAILIHFDLIWYMW